MWNAAFSSVRLKYNTQFMNSQRQIGQFYCCIRSFSEPGAGVLGLYIFLCMRARRQPVNDATLIHRNVSPANSQNHTSWNIWTPYHAVTCARSISSSVRRGSILFMTWVVSACMLFKCALYACSSLLKSSASMRISSTACFGLSLQ
jgi:hypothetical protein